MQLHHYRFSAQLLTAIILGSAIAAASAGDDWPQFRGPNCTGISATAGPLPVSFSATENVRWSAAAGDGVGARSWQRAACS